MGPKPRNDEDDDRKAFLSRVPTSLDEDALYTVLQKEFGYEAITEVSTVKEKTDEDESDIKRKEDTNGSRKSHSNEPEPFHKGFAFIVFSSVEAKEAAIKKGSIQWNVNGDSNTKKRKLRTMYIGSIVRDSSTDDNPRGENTNSGICYLWRLGRCTHGDNCKFAHIGEGSCVPNCNNGGRELSYGERMKKRKCFSFKKTGKCKLGESCPYSHECTVIKTKLNSEVKNDQEVIKDCINWKTKGKCRKGDKCKYRHNPELREKALEKKEKKKTGLDKGKKRKSEDKSRQPLSVRVFGLNYDTNEGQIRKYFSDCGLIVELTFPKFEDSGRSKGFCGILFQSPKAVEKAVALDGLELDGRWLRIQAGKMYLKKWEENFTKVEPEKEKVFGEFGQKVKRRKRHGHKD